MRRKNRERLASFEERLGNVESLAASSHGALFGCPVLDRLRRFVPVVNDDGAIESERLMRDQPEPPGLMKRVRALEENR